MEEEATTGGPTVSHAGEMMPTSALPCGAQAPCHSQGCRHHPLLRRKPCAPCKKWCLLVSVRPRAAGTTSALLPVGRAAGRSSTRCAGEREATMVTAGPGSPSARYKRAC
ncbi:hypothetical protein Taro_015074 [Colocasia esculenta]|uniref:Uncharacterized protein n=1 Tax=Colocasia esculenta TaxID=4460 RepID=A0A843US45_COLES|nr:hypothetical protein [Colocasia esculenta]